MKMADLTTEEISEGRKLVNGPKIVFWLYLIVFLIGSITAIITFFTGAFDFFTEAGGILNLVGAIGIVIWAMIWVVLIALELLAVERRRPHAVGLGRLLLIIIMIFTFPIGTVMGAIVWRRFSHPAAQKYLNYL